MKTLSAMFIAVPPLLASGGALAQGGHMMNGGFWDGGWMGGYGGIWIPLLLLVAVVAIVVLVMNRK